MWCCADFGRFPSSEIMIIEFAWKCNNPVTFLQYVYLISIQQTTPSSSQLSNAPI